MGKQLLSPSWKGRLREIEPGFGIMDEKKQKEGSWEAAK